ncbi:MULTISPECIES: hypothetical protein [Ochrobactrum]|jgi:hypothetical protein|uniref:Uncharacterized protein n=1 Tax=Ochrobactrum quorumnocens TaxID=271865 RepID=A0A5N1JYN0_9HYPH|nr:MULTISPECIES: hypothetical protein [Brucella/Ochrobactrum group]KAA9367124.1 hypothetical protein F3W84_15065 [[Ochrobactrum] quorumnocens]MBD7992750.1 hypothetical protein [Ochrobactrum gallinarum]MDH7793166.1 hypothetical protein [Ochrobactrum sp. AN78]
MSSTTHRIDLHSSNRILNQMMARAGYITSRLKPLPGPLSHPSKLVLQNFMTGLMRDHRADIAPFPEPTQALGAV